MERIHKIKKLNSYITVSEEFAREQATASEKRFIEGKINLLVIFLLKSLWKCILVTLH